MISDEMISTDSLALGFAENVPDLGGAETRLLAPFWRVCPAPEWNGMDVNVEDLQVIYSS